MEHVAACFALPRSTLARPRRIQPLTICLQFCSPPIPLIMRTLIISLSNHTIQENIDYLILPVADFEICNFVLEASFESVFFFCSFELNLFFSWFCPPRRLIATPFLFFCVIFCYFLNRFFMFFLFGATLYIWSASVKK